MAECDRVLMGVAWYMDHVEMFLMLCDHPAQIIALWKENMDATVHNFMPSSEDKVVMQKRMQ